MDTTLKTRFANIYSGGGSGEFVSVESNLHCCVDRGFEPELILFGAGMRANGQQAAGVAGHAKPCSYNGCITPDISPEFMV